jgi:hypothetical protein
MHKYRRNEWCQGVPKNRKLLKSLIVKFECPSRNVCLQANSLETSNFQKG